MGSSQDTVTVVAHSGSGFIYRGDDKGIIPRLLVVIVVVRLGARALALRVRLQCQPDVAGASTLLLVVAT